MRELTFAAPTRTDRAQSRQTAVASIQFSALGIQLSPQTGDAQLSLDPVIAQRNLAGKPTGAAPMDSIGAPAAASSLATMAARNEEASRPSVDVDAMAREVYQILRRRLRVEQERAHGSLIR
jgi:hypothetical protein